MTRRRGGGTGDSSSERDEHWGATLVPQGDSHWTRASLSAGPETQHEASMRGGKEREKGGVGRSQARGRREGGDA